MRKRYILRYYPTEPPPEADRIRIRKFPGVRVLDETPRMMLVEATVTATQSLREELPEWSLNEDKSYAVPNPLPFAPVK